MNTRLVAGALGVLGTVPMTDAKARVTEGSACPAT